MREANRIPVELQDSFISRLVESALVLNKLPGRPAQCRRDEQRVAGTRAEPAEAGLDELTQPGRHGKRLARPRLLSRFGERPCELERVERIAGRGVVQPQQRRPGELGTESLADELVERSDAQRRERDAP